MEDTILLDDDGHINKLFRPIIFLVRKLILNIVVMSKLFLNLFYRELFYSRQNDINTSWSDSASSVSLFGCIFLNFFTWFNVKAPDIPFSSFALSKSITTFGEKPKLTNKVCDFTPVKESVNASSQHTFLSHSVPW